MHLEATERFEKDYRALPPELKLRVKKTLRLLAQHPTYPSLHHKKMAGHEDVYEVRVTDGYRLTYQRVGDVGHLRRVGPHDILRHP